MREVGRRWAVATSGILVAGLLAAGVGSAAAQEPDPALDWSNYEKVTLTKDTGEPIDMAVLPDGRVLHTARNGDVRLTDPSVGTTDVVSTFDVYSNSEDGLQGIALDPDFATNQWIYVYYAPREMEGTAQNGAEYPATTPGGSSPNQLPAGEDVSYWDQWLGYNQLVRVQWDDATNSLDLSTEQVIIKVETQRGQCCHVGGDIDFDDDGNVYLSTGDNTPASTPGANGFAPNNNAPGFNPGFDSRRGAGSTNDLRGAILRIHVEDDGSYTIPDGNLFDEAADTEDQTRPELFVMGARNPFRMEVDPETNSVSWGDYGPDSGVANPDRGPMGLVEWNTTGIDQPINAGWPYCTGDNFNYNEWDYATATPGDFFDCGAGAENNSTWNTGQAVVPPSVPADLYYGDDSDDQPWPELTDFDPQGGQGPMGGPVYHYDPAGPDTQLPEYWDGKAFFAEFSQDYLAAFTVDWPDGPVTDIEHFLPNASLTENFQPITDSPIDIEFGPDGSLYILDYGDGFFSANPDAGLYRVDYVEGNKSPTAVISADPISASEAPLTVQFDGSASNDPEGDALTYDWDLDGDGTFESSGASVEWTYTDLGAYSARLRVTDPGGRIGLTSQQITVGNVAPTVNVESPPPGAFFDWGDAVPFTVTTSDPEDGDDTVCSNVEWTFGLGHDRHAHPLSQGTGCNFSIPTPVDAVEHGETENIFGVVVVRYTDLGAAGIDPATGEVAFILNPKYQEAEWADESSGVEIVEDPEASGFDKVDSFDPGDYLAWDPVNFLNVESVTATASGEGTLELRWDAPDAAPFATIEVDSDELADAAPADLSGAPEGTGVLYVTSTGGVVLDALAFGGDGVADVEPPEVSIELDPAEPNGPDGAWIGSVGFSITATDNGSVASTQYSKDGGQTWFNVITFGSFGTFCTDGGFGPCVVDDVGTTDLRYRATDAAGNVSEEGQVEITIVEPDETPPEVSIELDPAEPNGPDDAWVGSVGFSITATDDVEVDTVEYSKDDGATWLVQGSFGSFTFCTEGGFGPCVVDEVGTTNLLYRATDTSGNVSEVGEVEITIAPDIYAPEVSARLIGTFSGDFTPAQGYDTAGTATMTVTDSSTTVSAELSGLAVADNPHQAHLHEGVCGAMPMGGHYKDDPDGPSEPPNELWLVDDPNDPDAGFTADGDGNASVTGSAEWSARSSAQAVMVHGGELGLPRGCATLDTSNSSVEVAIDAKDLGDLDTVEYRLDGGDWTVTQSGSVSVIEPGDHTVEFRATDTGGNVSEVGEATFSIVTDPDAPRILTFYKTAGFTHGSIGDGRQAIKELAAEDGVVVDETNDASFFTEENLARYDAVVWLSTTGDVLDDDQQAAFESYIQDGGGFAGVHAASDTEYDWEWYGGLVGAYFAGHPPGTPEATLNVEDATHPSTDHLPADWTRVDEWYSFQENPRADVHVLMTIDESTYDVGDLAMGDHPMSWCHAYDGGRSWYTALGHTNASYTTDELFREHLWEGISTAAGYVDTDCYADDGGVQQGDQEITVTVPDDDGGNGGGGDFVWSIAGNGSVDLGDMADQGRYLQATGPMDPIIVTDTRSGGPPWSISGQVSDFAPSDLAGNHLGWNPRVIEQGAGAQAGERVPSGINGGPGLSVPQTLASADDGHEAGTSRVGAQFDLRFPAGTDAGDYTATLTITALS